MFESTEMEELCALFLQTVHQFGQLEKKTHTFGTEKKLHLSETHTIVDIGNHEHINISKLAKLQGISRSAVCQMIGRLVKKGFVRKDLSPETENEVVLSLTESGKKILLWHAAQHVLLREKLTDIFAGYPDDTIVLLQLLMTEMQDLWKTIPNQVK